VGLKATEVPNKGERWFLCDLTWVQTEDVRFISQWIKLAPSNSL